MNHDKKPSLWGTFKKRVGEADRRFIFFASLEAVFWAMIAPSSYFVVFMYDQGFTNVEVGIGLAVNAIVNFIFLPIWGMVADRLGSKRKTLLILYVGVCISSVLTTFIVGNVWVTICLCGIVIAFRGSVPALTDSWLVEETNKPDKMGNRLNYGPIRMCGSIGYAIAAYLFYLLFNNLNMDTSFSFLFSAILCVFTYWLVASYHKVNPDAQESNVQRIKVKMSELAPKRLFKNYYFLTFAFIYMLISVPGNFGMSYIATLLGELGGAPVFVGAISSIRALCEVPTLLFSRKIINKVGYVKTLFIIGALLFTEQLSYIVCNQVWQVVAFQMLHGSINGLLLGAAVNYIFSLVPRELSATAQTFCTAACSITAIAGNFLSGLVIDAFGVRMIYIICTICIGSAIALFALSLFIGKRLQIPKYDAETDEVSKNILRKLQGESI